MRDQKKTLTDRDIPLTRRVLQNEVFHAGEDSKTKYAGWVMASSGSPSWLVTPECTILRIRSIVARVASTAQFWPLTLKEFPGGRFPSKIKVERQSRSRSANEPPEAPTPPRLRAVVA